jgi:hypothetical protein
LWLLGYPEAALADADHALKDAREIGHAATLIYALCFTSNVHAQCGGYATANTQCDEAVALADQKGVMLLKAAGMLTLGSVLTMTDKATDAVHTITSGMTLWRTTGATLTMPVFLGRLNRLVQHSNLLAEMECGHEAATSHLLFCGSAV